MKEDRLSGLAHMHIHKHDVNDVGCIIYCGKTSLTISQHSETGGFKLFGFTVTRKKKGREGEREREKKEKGAFLLWY